MDCAFGCLSKAQMLIHSFKGSTVDTKELEESFEEVQASLLVILIAFQGTLRREQTWQDMTCTFACLYVFVRPALCLLMILFGVKYHYQSLIVTVHPLA